MRKVSGMGGVTIPDGWESAALFGRLVTAGVCGYEYLRSVTTTPRDVFQMLRMLDFRDYCELKAMEKARKRP